jgi:hypothetical protein
MNEARLFAGVALAALLLEVSPLAAPVTAAWREWLASNAMPPAPETVTAVEIAGKSFDPLSAALTLRAVLPLEPAGIVFLDPIANDANTQLLVSKLGDARVPVVFTASEHLDPLTHVVVSEKIPALARMPALLPADHAVGGTSASGQIVARENGRTVPSSSVRAFLLAKNISPDAVTGRAPGAVRLGTVLTLSTNTAGEPVLGPFAANPVTRMNFGELMVRTERSEHGEIGADLDALFRGRWVAVQLAGGRGADCLAALLNGLVENSPPVGLAALGLLLAACVPLWPRRGRVLAACGAACAWALMALAFYADFHFVAPLFPVLLPPVLAIFSKAASHKPEQRELAA